MRIYPLFPIGIALGAGAPVVQSLQEVLSDAWAGHWTGTTVCHGDSPSRPTMNVPTTLDVSETPSGELRLAFTFQEGPNQACGTVDHLRVAKDGKTATLVEDGAAPGAPDRYTIVQFAPDCGRMVMTTHALPEDRRYTIDYSADQLFVTEETASGKNYAFRHAYRFHRETETSCLRGIDSLFEAAR